MSKVVAEMIIKDLMVSGHVTPTLWRDGIPYFNKLDTLALLQACYSPGVGILGIEGFVVRDDSLQPQMDWIADFSDAYKSNDYAKFVEESVKYSIEFLEMQTLRDDIVF